MWNYLSTVLYNMGCREITVRGVEDHVHSLANLGKRCEPATLIQDLKSESSKWVKTLDDALAHFYWQTGYGMFSVGARERDIVREYILRQEEHHKTETFQDEYRRLLRENNIEIDERYLWD